MARLLGGITQNVQGLEAKRHGEWQKLWRNNGGDNNGRENKEKLMELIEESTGVVYGGEYGDEEIFPPIDIFDEEIERIADHLIAHGVTIKDREEIDFDYEAEVE